MLILSRKTDQQIKIGDDITLTIIEMISKSRSWKSRVIR